MTEQDEFESIAESEPAPAPAPLWGGRYGKGYRPDAHDTSKDLSIRHLLGARVGQSPSEAMAMEAFIDQVGIKDQKQTSECVAFALARCLQLRCALLGIPLKQWPSTTNIYTVARAMERHLEGHAPSEPLEDGGSVPSLAIDGINKWGVTDETRWPFDPNTVNNEPTMKQLEDASQFKVPGKYRIASVGAQRLEDVKQTLAAGYPILGGFAVDEAFENYMGGLAQKAPPIPAAVGAPDLTKNLGGHALCLLGYKTFPGGVTLIRGCNSWGNVWGDNGLFWASAAWLLDESVMDLLALTFDPSHYAVKA